MRCPCCGPTRQSSATRRTWSCTHGRSGLVAELLRLGARCLAPAGRLVIRGERGVDLPEMPAGLVERERRAYGRSWLALLERDAADRGPLR